MLNILKVIFLTLCLSSHHLIANETAFDKFIIKQYQFNKAYTEQINTLKESIAQLNYQLEQQEKDYQALKNSTFRTQTVKKDQPIKNSIVIGNRAYRHARNLMRSEQYEKAIKALTQYIKDYPDSENVSDAKFWLANSYAANSEFDHAARKYLLFTIQHPEHHKIPNALYRLAIAQHEIKQSDKAKIILKSIVRRFPQHKITASAKKSLELLEQSVKVKEKPKG